MNLNSVKQFAAQLFDVLGINDLGHFIQRKTLFPFIRAVNYHDTPQNLADNFEKQLQFYSKRFVNVDRKILSDFLASGKWIYDKPGIIISFDDGLRSHYEVAAKLLEKYNFTGWFFVPSRWIADSRTDIQPEEVSNLLPAEECLTLEQLKYLDKKHVVGCHTRTHVRLSKELSTKKLKTEILTAQNNLEEMLGHKIDIFCWVGGEEFTYSREAAGFIKGNYNFSFMTNTSVITANTNTLQLQRSNIEAYNSLPLVNFQISGLMDMVYYPKRKRVNELTR